MNPESDRSETSDSESTDSASADRLAGLDLIAGLYAIGILLMGWWVWSGNPRERVLGLVLAPVFAILSVAAYFRIGWWLLVGFVCLQLALEATLAGFYIGAALGYFQMAAQRSPLEQLGRQAFRLIFLVLMLRYLLQSDVRAAFATQPEPGPEPFASAKERLQEPLDDERNDSPGSRDGLA